MKNIILSADGDCVVYSVPDVVADNLREYCIEFCDEWLWKSPNAKNTEVKMVYAITKKILLNI